MNSVPIGKEAEYVEKFAEFVVENAAKIDNAEVDAKFRHNVRWDSINPQINFELPQGKRKRAYGKIEKNIVKYDIAFI